MRHTTLIALTLTGFYLLAPLPQPHAAPALTHEWSKGFGDADHQFQMRAAFDASGNVYITGYFAGTINLGGANLTSAGNEDIFVAKFNASGVHQWSQRFGDAASQTAFSIQTDGFGNVVITGNFSGTLNFGGIDLVSSGTDVFLATFNASGVHQWSARYGDSAVQSGTALEIDNSNNILLTGYFAGQIDFGNGTLTAVGGNDVFLAKFNSAGSPQWSTGYNDTGDAIAYAVAVDSNKNITITGVFDGSITFGGSILNSQANSDVFVARISAGGAHLNSQSFGGPDDSFPLAVALDAAGNPVIGGYFLNKVNFGGGDLVSAGENDVFVAKFTTSLAHTWSKRFGGTDNQACTGLDVDAAGNVLFTSGFYSTIDFGGGVLTTDGGPARAYLALLDPNGAHLWSRAFGSVGIATGNVVRFDANDDVVWTGTYSGSITIGAQSFSSAGNSDFFLAKLSTRDALPAVTSVVDVPNDQGRKLKIQFDRSGFDDEISPTPVVRYDAFRRDDPPPSLVAGGSPAATVWTQVASVNAYTANSYGIEVPSLGDSTVALGQYQTVYYVRAASAVPGLYFDSPPDSGYSVDNLAPGIPTDLLYVSGDLTWDESGDEDFDYFTVYGGSTSSFGAATLIDYTVDPAVDVAAAPYTYYFVTATDFSGNEGKPAVLNALTGVGDTLKHYVLSISSYPNPFNPETTIRYTLPSAGRVQVRVYDARGALVSSLVDEEKLAGAYTRAWNGTDGSGNAVSSGVYFARVEHASGTRSYKMLLLK